MYSSGCTLYAVQVAHCMYSSGCICARTIHTMVPHQFGRRLILRKHSSFREFRSISGSEAERDNTGSGAEQLHCLRNCRNNAVRIVVHTVTHSSRTNCYTGILLYRSHARIRSIVIVCVAIERPLLTTHCLTHLRFTYVCDILKVVLVLAALLHTLTFHVRM